MKRNNKMSILAYIPARAGSKRIPRKNVRLLGGKPVVVRVIEAIKKSKLADKIVVSTDDARIKKIAESAGAEALALRSAKLSDDRTPFTELLKKDVPRYLKAFGMRPENTTVLFVLATAALTDAGTYQRAYKIFLRQKASVLVATRPFRNNPYRALVPDKAGWKALHPKELLMRSQDLPKAQEDSGLFYFLDHKKAAKEKKHWFLMKGLCCYPAPDSAAVDVDTEADWLILEKKYRALHGTKRRKS